MTLKELRKKREEIKARLTALAGVERDGGFNDETRKEFDETSKELKTIEGDIKRLEELRSIKMQKATADKAENTDGLEFRGFLRGETRSQVVGDNAKGGFTVGGDVQSRVIQAIKSYSGMIESAGSISTSTGETIKYPTLDDTANEAVIKNELDERRKGPDLEFGSIEIGAYVYDSGIIKISNELIQDSKVNIENIVINALSERISRKLQKDFTLASGTNEPSGIITQVTEGITTAGAGITADELLALSFKPDEGYLSKSKWMMNTNTLLAIAKLKDGQGNYLLTDAKDGINKKLFGYSIVINNNMPDIGSKKIPVIFGDISQYLVRNVSNISVFRFNELYQETNEIGFKASARFDGTLLQPRAVKSLKIK